MACVSPWKRHLSAASTELKTRSQREFESRIRQSRGLSHPAAPHDKGNGWETLCARSGCDVTFITPTKQRKYCSTGCRQLAAEDRTRRVATLSGILLSSCAATRCDNRFLPDPRNPSHMYCSVQCRKQANREDSDLSSPVCARCKRTLPPSKTRRRVYCDATCRITAHRAAKRNET